MQPGEEVCISYLGQAASGDVALRPKNNLELMRDYGFVIPGNTADRLDFNIGKWWLSCAIFDHPLTCLPARCWGEAPTRISYALTAPTCFAAGACNSRLSSTLDRVQLHDIAAAMQLEHVNGDEVTTAARQEAVLQSLAPCIRTSLSPDALQGAIDDLLRQCELQSSW